MGYKLGLEAKLFHGAAGATAATLLPICRDAAGVLKYVLLYNLA